MERLVDKFIKERGEVKNGDWKTSVIHYLREILVHKGRKVCELNFASFTDYVFALSDEIYLPYDTSFKVVEFLKENGFVVRHRKMTSGKIEPGLYLVSLTIGDYEMILNN